MITQLIFKGKMPCFCVVGTIRAKNGPRKNKSTMTDFRKSDPTYLNWKPRTASEAIEKFYRHKKLGVPPHLWPEVFVDCASELPDAESIKFEAWLVNPQGQALKAPTVTATDIEIEMERQQLLREANARDLQTVPEVIDDYMDVDDEKADLSVSMQDLSMKTHIPEADFEMVTVG